MLVVSNCGSCYTGVPVDAAVMQWWCPSGGESSDTLPEPERGAAVQRQ